MNLKNTGNVCPIITNIPANCTNKALSKFLIIFPARTAIKIDTTKTYYVHLLQPKKIMNNKKEMIIYSTMLLISIALCIAYYSDEYGKSLLGMVNDKINLEKMVWIK